MKLKNEIYDVLKWISCICVPAIVTFLGVVLGVLDIDPKTVNIIVTIIGAIGTLIGALIGVSTSAYNKQKEADDDGKDKA
jgi:membrane protein DedA with SNARE-associated domain